MWLSEVILQQTRVEQGQPYWERFMHTFPTINHLADASEESVLRLWQGLGYYSRARNLHATAKMVAYEIKTFPTTYSEILKLKGVGPYTAAAIASICFDEPRPVVDGNVFRFASRYFGIQEDISKGSTRAIFEEILTKEISHEFPGSFNQAMMEYGSIVCSPKPKCQQCLFNNDCYAHAKQLQNSLPIKLGKTKVRDRFFNYVIFEKNGRLFMNERKEKDVWSGLFDFYLIEGKYEEEDVLNRIRKQFEVFNMILEDVSGTFKHILSHQRIYGRFYKIIVTGKEEDKITEKSGLKSYSIEEVLNLPKPKLIVNYLEQSGIK